MRLETRNRRPSSLLLGSRESWIPLCSSRTQGRMTSRGADLRQGVRAWANVSAPHGRACAFGTPMRPSQQSNLACPLLYAREPLERGVNSQQEVMNMPILKYHVTDP